MARPRKFDEQRAIDAAMRAFWTAGYEATSTQDLCAATGLGRSSIYNTFVSKRELFDRALRRYTAIKNAEVFELLDEPGPGREKLHTLLLRIAGQPESEPPGCLVVNSLMELAPRDPEIAAVLREDQRLRLDALTATIEAAQREGDVDAGHDARELAQFIVATISGIRVAARGGADRATLTAIAETAMRCL